MRTRAHGIDTRPGERRTSTRRRGRLRVLWAPVTVLVIVASAVPAEAQFSARPVFVTFSPDDGASPVMVRNEGDTVREFRFYAGDYVRVVEGGHDFLSPGSHPRSCHERLSLAPDGAVLEPGETVDLRVSVKPGAETCWSMLFVQPITAASEEGITVGQRIGIKIFGIGDGLAPEGRIDSVWVGAADEDESVALVLRLVFSNTGDLPLRPEGRIALRTTGGEELSSLSVPRFSVLPGHSRRISFPMEDELPPGDYLAIPILEIGAEYLVGGEARFRVTPDVVPAGPR